MQDNMHLPIQQFDASNLIISSRDPKFMPRGSVTVTHKVFKILKIDIFVLRRKTPNVFDTSCESIHHDTNPMRCIILCRYGVVANLRLLEVFNVRDIPNVVSMCRASRVRGSAYTLLFSGSNLRNETPT